MLCSLACGTTSVERMRSAVTETHIQSEALPTPISLENLLGLHLASSSNKESYTHLIRRAMKIKPILLSDVLLTMSGM